MSAVKKVNVNRKYKTPKGILRATLRLFEESRDNWTTNVTRQDRASANGGTAFCTLGAIDNFAADWSSRREAKDILRDNLPNSSIVMTNDRRGGRKNIIAALKKAVA